MRFSEWESLRAKLWCKVYASVAAINPNESTRRAEADLAVEDFNEAFPRPGGNL